MADVFKNLDPSCQAEIQTKPEKLSEECQEQLQKVISSTMGRNINDMGDTRNKNEEKKKKRKKSTKKSRKKDRTGVVSVIMGFLTAALVGLIGACWYINRELDEAGMYKKPQKQLSKKKSAKQKRSAI